MAAAQEGAAAVGMEGAAERSKGNSFDVIGCSENFAMSHCHSQMLL